MQVLSMNKSVVQDVRSLETQMMDDAMHKYFESISWLAFEGGEEQQFSVGHISIVGHTAAAAPPTKGGRERATHVASAHCCMQGSERRDGEKSSSSPCPDEGGH